MSADSDKETACPISEKQVNINDAGDLCDDEICEKKRCKPQRKVSFPDDDHLVTQCFKPANPWQDVPPITRAQLAAEYLEYCRRHHTPPIDSVLQQIRELPESSIGGCMRAPRLALTECSLLGCSPCDALEAVLSRVQFKRLELRDAQIDDEAAEALFDMVEYYESATVVAICGPRQFGIRGWQAASRLIKKSSDLSELEISECALEPSHAPVLARALKPQSCRLYSLCLTRAGMAGEPLLSLVIALKSNMSLRELRLGDNRLCPSDAAQLSTLLRLNHRIQMLDLSNNQIQDIGVGHVCDALVLQSQMGCSDSTSPLASPDSKGLAVLVLWNNQLTRNCAQHLTKALRASQSLLVLNIGRNPIGCEAIRCIPAGSRLVCLGVQGTRFTSDAAHCIAQLLADSPCLQRLDLRDNKLSSAGLQAILSVVKKRTTLTQIDLDEPVAATNLSEDSSVASVARVTRELQAACRVPSAEQTAPHRKISLTCHTAMLPSKSTSCEEENRATRLRSPLPSPAGSPVPPPHNSRFYVTRVTPHSLSESPGCSVSGTAPSASRFTVVHVAEPPKIKVHKTPEQPRKSASRFSVTRNYDTMYNPTPVPSPPPDSASPTPSLSLMEEINQSPQVSIRLQDETEQITETPKSSKSSALTKPRIEIEQDIKKTEYELNKVSDSRGKELLCTDENTLLAPTKIVRAPTPAIGIGVLNTSESECSISPEPEYRSKNEDIEAGVMCKVDTEQRLDSRNVDDTIQIEVHKPSGCVKDVNKRLCLDDNTDEKEDRINEDLGVRSDIRLAPDPIPSQIATMCPCESVSDKVSANSPSAKEDVSVKSDIVKNDDVKSEKLSFMDKSEQLSHNEDISYIGEGKLIKTETKLTKQSTEMSENEKVDVQVSVTVVKENVHSVNMQTAKVHSDQNNDNIRIDSNVSCEKKDGAMKQIEAITEDLSNLIKEMKDLTTKTQVLTKKDVKFNSDCTQTEPVDRIIDSYNDVPANLNRDSVVLKKNKSESSLDSPDLEVSRLMNKRMVVSPFCDSSSSLEISGSSMESLNALEQNTQITMKPIIIQESIESDNELDRRKFEHVTLSTESSIESNTSDIAPVHNSNFLNMSLSSNESVSPIIFGKNKKIHGSLSSLEASVSSLESARLERLMVSSADSGIEHSLQHPTDKYDSSNEGTLTNTSAMQDTAKKQEGFQVQETLTSSPKRTHSLLDVPVKNKPPERTRKISWVAPSSSFHIPKPEPEKNEIKLTTHLEKLLSIFQHPTSLFSKSQSDDEKKSNSNTPPRKDSSLTSSFWSWGSAQVEKEKDDDKDDSSEHTDSTLSERVQVSFVDESFSKKLDSKTPSTDTDNTLSEFQSFPVQGNSETSDASQEKIDTVTEITTDDNLVQTCLDISLKCIDNASSNGNKDVPGECDIIDLMKPNDFNKNVYESPSGDDNKNPKSDAPTTDVSERKLERTTEDKRDELKVIDPVRPRSFAAVLKASGSENSLEKQTSPEGQPVAKLPIKVIRGIKENISPENTLTSSMTNTKTLATELTDRQMKTHTVVNALWEVTLDKNEPKHDEVKAQGDLAPIATIDETSDETADNSVHIPLEFIDDKSTSFDMNTSFNSGLTSIGDTSRHGSIDTSKLIDAELTTGLENVDLGKDALSYLIFENQSFQSTSNTEIKSVQSSLAEELKEAENKEKHPDLSPELVLDEISELPDVFPPIEGKISERAKLKKCNSLEDVTQRASSTEKECKKIAFKMPEVTGTIPRDIPERRTRIRTRSGSSPKSLPESLNRPCPLSRMEAMKSKKKKRVSSLGKIAKDSLLALNMSEEEIAEFRRSYITSVESLRSLESVSEDANSQSGNSGDSRCRSCLRTSQESLMSLDSINEDCKCGEDCPRTPHSAR